MEVLFPKKTLQACWKFITRPVSFVSLLCMVLIYWWVIRNQHLFVEDVNELPESYYWHSYWRPVYPAMYIIHEYEKEEFIKYYQTVKKLKKDVPFSFHMRYIKVDQKVRIGRQDPNYPELTEIFFDFGSHGKDYQVGYAFTELLTTQAPPLSIYSKEYEGKGPSLDVGKLDEPDFQPRYAWSLAYDVISPAKTTKNFDDLFVKQPNDSTLRLMDINLIPGWVDVPMGQVVYPIRYFGNDSSRLEVAYYSTYDKAYVKGFTFRRFLKDSLPHSDSAMTKGFDQYYGKLDSLKAILH